MINGVKTITESEAKKVLEDALWREHSIILRTVAETVRNDLKEEWRRMGREEKDVVWRNNSFTFFTAKFTRRFALAYPLILKHEAKEEKKNV